VSTELFVNDVFWTIQGEGANAGRRALFVRMPFCNLACAWCDTKFDTFKRWSEEDFRAFAEKEPARFAVVTGGEPMMHKHTPKVVAVLKSLGFEVAAESNGNFPPVDGFDFITCSPKRDADNEPYWVHPKMLPHVSEFKYVVDQDFDFEILKRHDVIDGRRYSLSPEFGNMAASLGRIQAFIKENPKWRVSLQTHKWMNIP
jgi:organic radical activating enzyme